MENLNIDKPKTKEGIVNESIACDEMINNIRTYDINGYEVALIFKDTGLTLDNIVESYLKEKLFVF